MTYRDQLQLHDYFNANHRLKDTIKGIIQMLLEHYCVWGNNHLARKPVLVFDYCHSSDFLLTSSLDLPVCNFVQFPCVCWGKLLRRKREARCTEQWHCCFSSFIPNWETQASSATPHRACLPPHLTSFVAPLLQTHLRNVTSFLYYGAHIGTQYLRWTHSSAKCSGRVTSLDWLSRLCLMHPQNVGYHFD